MFSTFICILDSIMYDNNSVVVILDHQNGKIKDLYFNKDTFDDSFNHHERAFFLILMRPLFHYLSSIIFRLYIIQIMMKSLSNNTNIN